MTSYHPAELDYANPDSVASSPRSDYFPHSSSHDFPSLMRFMCSFGGKISLRPHDNQLRYVGGETRIVAVHRSTSFSGLLSKLSKIVGTTNITVKYQLPNEDLDALISVTTDEDVENMMDEYDRLAHNQNPRISRLRLFLFPKGEDSRNSSISSFFEGSTNRENWFVDALNGGGSELQRGRSEVSSIVSEVPDYLLGLDNLDEQRPKSRPILNDNVSASDPGSPAPVASSPFCSTSSSIPNLPPVKTKPDDPVSTSEFKENPVAFSGSGESEQLMRLGNQALQYMPESHHSSHSTSPLPVYYVPGPVQPGTIPVQNVPIGAPYVQQFPIVPGQVPVGYQHLVPGMGQIYLGGMRPVTQVDSLGATSRVVQNSGNHNVYYEVRNSAEVPVYPMMVIPGGGVESDYGKGRIPESN